MKNGTFAELSMFFIRPFISFAFSTSTVFCEGLFDSSSISCRLSFSWDEWQNLGNLFKEFIGFICAGITIKVPNHVKGSTILGNQLLLKILCVWVKSQND